MEWRAGILSWNICLFLLQCSLSAMSICRGNLCSWALHSPLLVFFSRPWIPWAEWSVISVTTHLSISFLSLIGHSQVMLPFCIWVLLNPMRELYLFLKWQLVTVNLSKHLFFFFFPPTLNDTWIDETLVLCIYNLINALAIEVFTSDSLPVIHFINSMHHILSSFILNCCIIYSDKFSCYRSSVSCLVFSYPLAAQFWFLNNSLLFSLFSVSCSDRSAPMSCQEVNRYFFLLRHVQVSETACSGF